MRVGLIDADVVIYRTAAAVEKPHRWPDGLWTFSADELEGERAFHEMLDRIITDAKLDDVVLALTDSVNWRKKVLPSYKANREGKQRPLLLNHLREVAKDTYKTYHKPTLEGDDCLGILATMKSKDERVICSIDKDFKTIPCEFFNIQTGEVIKHDEHKANYWHMVQALTGDVTDGYAGCPGIGIKTAEKILQEALDSGTPWANQDELDALYWKHVVAAYEKAGLTEGAALVQAQVARICRASDYDFKKGKVILWTPKSST